jgi:Holliday junction DNA helicase RuvA
MIRCLEGELVAVAEGRAHVRCGPITYELHVPAADEQRLSGSIGETASFHTLHYLEGQGQGSSFIPRLIGFTSEADRAFFELFTTVKGMGNRKALRALALPFGDVAEAIAGRDVDVLRSLPEVGKRTAETIVAELHGKVDRFVELKPSATSAPAGPGPGAGVAHDAVAMLTQLGESALGARRLVDRALAVDPALDSAEALVAAAFRLKESV